MLRHDEELATNLEDWSNSKSIYQLFSHENHEHWALRFNMIGLVFTWVQRAMVLGDA